MKQTIRAFIKKPAVLIGFITALIFQLLFSVIWLTGYDNITKNVTQFKIAVVNEDPLIGQKLLQNLKQNVAFQILESLSLNEAMNQLEHRKVQMVMQIPDNFSQLVQNPKETAKVVYTLNESNVSMVKSVMQGVEGQITHTINQNSVKSSLEAALQQSQIPTVQATSMAEGLSKRVESEVTSIHSVSNFSHLMVPMMMLLASFTGSMLFSMELNKISGMLRGQFTKWQRFYARCVLNTAAAILIALVGTTAVNMLGVHSDQGFIMMWLFQITYVITFIFTAQFAFLIFGDAGAWVNIAMLSLQLLSSGATMPRELLSKFYFDAGRFLPATYAVDGIMNLVTGGPSVVNHIGSLAIILLIIIGMSLLLVAARREAEEKNPVQQLQYN